MSMTKLTTFQKFMLKYLDGQRRRICGYVITPTDIRRDADLAAQLYWAVN